MEPILSGVRWSVTAFYVNDAPRWDENWNELPRRGAAGADAPREPPEEKEPELEAPWPALGAEEEQAEGAIARRQPG